jgi:non-specific serine/threonine protein kinase
VAELTTAINSVPNNLPRQLTSFVGRERELAEVKRLLGEAPLLTLTGAGGAGKTRLALRVAAEASGDFADGVWLVELAPLANPTLVPQAVATALGVREAPGRALTDTLTEYLHTREILLVFDNCEHLVAAAAQLTETLLQACPRLRILATSREALGLAGELAWRVPSLTLPDPDRFAGAGPGAESILVEYEAVRLFLDRATFALPSFALSDQNAPTIAQICRRLDGMPLAIELAAARVRALTVEQIAERLDDRFRLLTGGSRTSLPRQQTLRATVDWSYDLLSEAERVLLHHLSVFSGGWALEAAEAVCGGDAVPSSAVLDLLVQLVDRSLVLAEPQGVEERYRLLETVRQYAREKLLEAGEANGVRDRHRDYFLSLAEQADPELRGREQLTWLERLTREQDNLRAAIEWSLTRDPAETALRLAGALGWFWDLRGHWSEGRAWVERCLELATPNDAQPDRTATQVAPWVRGRIFLAAGILALVQTDFAAARPSLEEAIQLSRSAGDHWGVARALMSLAPVEAYQGRHGEAAAHLQEGLALFRAVGDKWGTALALAVLN